jgi:hypothetical protein
MGASGWSYFVEYQPDLQRAFEALQARVLAEGDYWWAPAGKLASECPDRPKTMRRLFEDQHTQESGTHSILDMVRVLRPGEERGVEHGLPEYGVIIPTGLPGVQRLTREHVDALEELPYQWGAGHCAVLHDAEGRPAELYFWGASGD